MNKKAFVVISSILASAAMAVADVAVTPVNAAPAQAVQPAAPAKEVNTLVESDLFDGSVVNNLSISAAVAYESEYIFRGKYVSGHTISPIVDINYDLGYGFAAYAGYWGLYGVDNSFGENDYYMGVAYTYADITLDLGYLGYTYNDDSRDEHEFMAKVSYDTTELLGDFNVSPYAAFFYNNTLLTRTYEIGLSYSAPITKWLIDENWGSIETSAYVGIVDDNRDGGYTYGGISADVVVAVTNNMNVSLGIRWACNNDNDDEISQKEQNLWFGTAVSFGF